MGKRQTIEPCIRQDKVTGTYYATLYYPKYATGTGKPDRKTLTFKTLTAARECLKKHKKAIKEGKANYQPKTSTLEDAINYYIENKILAETTKYGYRSCIKYISQHHIYKMDVTELKKIHIDEYIKFLSTLPIKLSNNTINHHLDLIRVSLNYLQLNYEDIDISVIKRITNLKFKKFVGKRYTKEEQNLLLKALDEYPDKRIVVAAKLGLFLGLRRGEICGLKWENIDFDNRKLNIKQTVTYAGHTLEKAPKSISSIRELPLPNSIISDLKEYKKYQEDCLDFFKQDAYSEKLDFVVVCDNLKPVRPNYLSGLWKKFLEDKNLKPMRFHDLRHNYISIGYEAGIAPLELAAMAGHGSTKMIDQTYAHLKEESILVNSKKIADLISSK